MPRKKIIKKEVKVSDEKIQEAVKEIIDTKAEWRVLDRELKLVRVYSIKQHGKDAKKLAQTFAAKIQGWCN